jgi:phage N-6-adenine-methyltransferase
MSRMNPGMYSSATGEWETPLDLFNFLDRKFHFTLDPCAMPANAKCSRYFTPREDGLAQTWEGNTVFVNPPYGREIARWVEKAYNEAKYHQALVVMLLPSRTDTKSWWHKHVMLASSIWLIEGRIKFGPLFDVPAPFPSCVVVFDPSDPRQRLLGRIHKDKGGWHWN